MKQKIVMKVQMKCDECRSKAMKHAVVNGVISVKIAGKDKDQVEVIGDGVDSVSLTCLLRKKFGYASLVSVEEFKEKEKEKDPTLQWLSSYTQYPHYVMQEVVHDPNPTGCSIM